MLRAIAVFAAMMMLVGSSWAQWGEASGENLVENPSFEQVQDGKPVGWSMPEAVYSLTDEVARTGELSLKYVNEDPDRYVMCTQALDLEPGKRYEVLAWVRTQNVQGEDYGASVCVEWNDAQGNYLGGYYPSGRKGDTPEWTRVGGVTGRIPENAAEFRVICYVRKEMTGTAWFDDVSVRRVRERPLRTVLMKPNYRGWVTDEGPEDAQVRATITPDDLEVGLDALALRMRLMADDGEILGERVLDRLGGRQVIAQMPLPELEPGQYELEVALTLADSGEVLAADLWDIVRRSGPMPLAYIDEHNRLIYDGEPFFPLGMYWGAINEEHLQIYTEAPFNCLMPYGRPSLEQMDLAQQYGLKVIYSIKDYYAGTRWAPDFIEDPEDEEPAVRRTVREYRDHPALLAWYLNDERPLSMLDRLIAHQEWVEEEDPNHPTWVVLYQVREVEHYIRTFDVIGTDPYPIPARPASMAAEWTELTREAVADSRPMWQVPQVHNWGNYRGYGEDARPPTYDEMRSMSWQCITEGADGLVYYSWGDLHRDETTPFEERWPDVKAVAEEIARHIPIILSVEPTPEVQIDAPDAVHSMLRQYEGETWLFLVNDSTRPQRVQLEWGGVGPGIEGEGLSVARERLTVNLPPLGVEIRTLGD